MWRIFPAVLSVALLGAHFFRAGNDLAVLGTLLLLGLMAVPRWWSARLVQAALVLGAFEWLRTAVMIAGFRAAAGQPAMRMWVILGSVAVVTAASALVFQHRRVAAFYRIGHEAG